MPVDFVNRLFRRPVVVASPDEGGRFKLSKGNQMNKLLAALIATFFAAGAIAADAAKPAASAAAKTEAKAAATEKKAEEAKPAASAAKAKKAKKEAKAEEKKA